MTFLDLATRHKIVRISICAAFVVFGFKFQSLAQEATVTVNWEDVIQVSSTTPTLQVVVNPMLKRGSPIHQGSFDALKNLKADFVRFVPWFPYPHAAVPELKEPTKTETFWNFSQIDPIMEDLMAATAGHPVVINFSTIPNWMFKGKPEAVPSDPNEVVWGYNQGRELRDTTMKEVGDYFARIFSWYTRGGFTDETGKFHKSDYHYKIPYWEVLNEPDLEHYLSPEVYTKIYDAVVESIRKIAPETKFIGISTALSSNPKWFEYFLNPANHKKGIKPDGISYHFYAFSQEEDEEMAVGRWQYSFFEQANNFLDRVRFIENIRKRLSPETFTDINELGTILAGKEIHTGNNIPGNQYWNLSGALYAYLYCGLTKLGIDIAGQSQLVGYPSQFPSVSMMDWTDGRPNARYWVLKLIKENFGKGDQLTSTWSGNSSVFAQGFITRQGKKILLINKRNKGISVKLPADFRNASIEKIDVFTVQGSLRQTIADGSFTLAPFGVAVVNMSSQ